jgi:hypothetical protein
LPVPLVTQEINGLAGAGQPSLGRIAEVNKCEKHLRKSHSESKSGPRIARRTGTKDCFLSGQRRESDNRDSWREPPLADGFYPAMPDNLPSGCRRGRSGQQAGKSAWDELSGGLGLILLIVVVFALEAAQFVDSGVPSIRS